MLVSEFIGLKNIVSLGFVGSGNTVTLIRPYVTLFSTAVAGVPYPRPHHAAHTVKFASDCLVKMKALMLKLVPILGSDTANLSLRIGLHSGPVTGGVLRGEKGR